MKRLTRRNSDGSIDCAKQDKCSHEEPCDECEQWVFIAEKLADYEETGFTPAKVAELAAYREAEAQGLLVKLPFKHAGRIYVLDWKVKGGIRKTINVGYHVYAKSPPTIFIKGQVRGEWYSLQDAFGTREEAAAALAAREAR